jgi:hypothetical protein
MMQQKAAQHVGIRAMGKWRASSFRERQGERLQMRAQVFALTKQLGTLQTSQMTAAVLTWKQPVVRQRDRRRSGESTKPPRRPRRIVSDEAMRRIENQSDAQHVDARNRLRAVETALAKCENETTRTTSRLELDFDAKLGDFRAQIADVRRKLMLRETGSESRRAKTERRPSTPTIDEEDGEEGDDGESDEEGGDDGWNLGCGCGTASTSSSGCCHASSSSEPSSGAGGAVRTVGSAAHRRGCGR